SVGGVFRSLEGYLYMRLRREIINLVRSRLLHDADDIGRVRHVAVMQMERNSRLVGIVNQMIEARGVEGRGTALDAMRHVALGEQELGEIGAILPGGARDQGDPSRRSCGHSRAPAISNDSTLFPAPTPR